MLAAAGVACGADGPTLAGPGPVPRTPVPVPPVPLTNPGLAFASNRDGLWRIYVANADGSGAVPIAAGRSPAWSPDGSQIAFLGSGSVLYTVSPAGSGLRSLNINGEDPSWSPDGRRLAFGAFKPPPSAIEVMDLDGSNRQRLHSAEDWVYQPAWSPDGRHIAFAVGSYIGDHSGIWIMNADGSAPRQLGPLDAGRPVWSPDSTRIAYASNSGIWISRESGAEATRVASGPGVSLGDWSADGRQILFARFTGTPTHSCRVHVIDIVGGAERQLIPDIDATTSPTYCDSQPVWARP
jgi:Tol biopolymer transport system component